MKTVLPKGAKITKTSKQCMVECAAEFISFVTSEAKYYCQLDQRDTITTEDLIDAMRKVGLNVIADYSFRYYQHYLNHDHACASGQYAPPPCSLPQDVHTRVSGQYYCPPPHPLPSQDVQACVSRQYYAPPPPPPLPLQDVSARNFSIAPNFMFPNTIGTGTFFGGDYQELPPPLLQQDVPAHVSSQYYAPPPPPPPLTLQNVQAHNFSMAPNFMFPNPIEMGTFFGGDDGEELPPSLLPQDVQACVSGQYGPPPPPPPQDVQARYFPMAPNFMLSNPIEMGSFFGDDDAEELPPPSLPQDVQALVSGQYTPSPPPLDVQARDFPMAPNFEFPNPIGMGAFFGDGHGEELPPSLLPQDVQACVSGQYGPPPPPPPQDVQARYFPMAPNFMLSNPIEMGSFFGDDDAEELPPPSLPQDVQALVSGQYTPSPPPLDVQARDFPMAPNFEFPNPIGMGAFFGDGHGEEFPPPPPLPQDVQARTQQKWVHFLEMVKNLVAAGGDGDGNSDDEGFDLIPFLNSDD
ncbi:hypothetical protein P8452_45016 [Trifolium repens]|nr:hypothetical protein P8452_45016 [Trifolium repens]